MISGKKFTYRVLPYTGKSSSPTFTKDGETPNVTLTVNNIVVENNQRQAAPVVFPSGFCSLPNDNTQMILFNSGVMGQNPIILGSITSIESDNPVTLQPGESYNYSNEWAIKYGNSAVQAYKLDTPNYLMTLPAGEWLGKFLTDIITRLTQIETYYNTHIHVAPGGNTAVPTVLLPDDADLTQDQTYINDGNYLLGPNAEVLP